MKKSTFTIFMLIVLISDADSQLVQSNFTSVATPQYICSGTATRLPYVYRATVSGLIPNTKYRYYTQACRYTDFGGSNSGAGNPILINGNSFRYSTSTSLSTSGGYDSLVSDSQGSYTGWFGFVHTGNARFTAGNYVYPTITLDSAGNGSTYFRFAMRDSILVMKFLDSANVLSGTGIYGISPATPKNIVSLYDNVNNTGRPLAMAIVENDGIDASVMSSLVQYYADSVDSRNGRWGTVIPNMLASGVRRVNVHRLSDASVAAFATDSDGIWPSGANTVNPAGGSAVPIRLTSQDIPLSVRIIASTPDGFSLEQNYPNPFNPATVLSFSIPSPGSVKLSVYDILGREAAVLVSDVLSGGTYDVSFNAFGMGSGVYIYRLEHTGDDGSYFTESRKMLLAK